MVCRGIVKKGKIELDAGVELPEGAVVRVETMADSESNASTQEETPAPTDLTKLNREEWLKEWRKVAEEVSTHWKSPQSVLQVLSEMRR